MKIIKKILTMLMLLIVVFAFFITVTEMPAKADDDGGTYCNEGATKYCWTSKPMWVCIDSGGDKCVNP